MKILPEWLKAKDWASLGKSPGVSSTCTATCGDRSESWAVQNLSASASVLTFLYLYLFFILPPTVYIVGVKYWRF